MSAIELTDDERAAVGWVKTLAAIALEDYRQERLRCGHSFGTKKVGLHDFEVTQFDLAMQAIEKILGTDGASAAANSRTDKTEGKS